MSKKKSRYPAEFLALLAKVTNRRAKIVIDHILKHGQITTEDLEKTYGYSHPPRAVQDVKDQGIPIIRSQTKNAGGRTIAVYRFGNPTEVRAGRLGGRRIFSKAFKKSLVTTEVSRCSICCTPCELRYLQVDHRVPYEIAGEEDGGREIVDFMLLCASCQRAKSWSCEHCDNWLKARLPEICRRCYWGSPAVYDHIALKEIRRLDIVWLGDAEVAEHTRLRNLAGGARIALPLYAKAALKEHVARVSAKQQHGLTSM